MDKRKSLINMKKFSVELVWNREFHWCHYGSDFDDIESAKKAAINIRDSGDGARVKKVQVINNEIGKVAWNG